MNKLFPVFVAIFGFATVTSAQMNTVNMVVPGTSVEVTGYEDECSLFGTDDYTCTVTIRYQSDVFPVEFIQNGKVLEAVYEADSASIGFEAIQGVRYKRLPNGGMHYMLEIRNPRGGTFLITTIGS